MGRDRGKFNKRGGRGGSSRFQATSAAEIELRNERLARFDANRARRREESAEAENGGRNEEQNDEEEIEGQEDVGQGIAGMSLNENQQNDAPREKTRKQREQEQKEKAAADYRRRHEAGLTEEYKRDMAKLAEVKKRREESAKRAEVEKEAQESIEKEQKAKAAALQADSSDDDSDSDDDKKKKKKKKKKSSSIPKLDKIAIKKMKPTQLKEHLKERGLDIQGNAKTLTQRLLDYEKNR